MSGAHGECCRPGLLLLSCKNSLDGLRSPKPCCSLAGRKCRYVYVAEFEAAGHGLAIPPVTGIAKIDLAAPSPEAAVAGRIPFGAGRSGGEAVFIPSSGSISAGKAAGAPGGTAASPSFLGGVPCALQLLCAIQQAPIRALQQASWVAPTQAVIFSAGPASCSSVGPHQPLDMPQLA